MAYNDDIDIPWRESLWYLSNCLSYHLLETHLLTDSQKEMRGKINVSFENENAEVYIFLVVIPFKDKRYTGVICVKSLCELPFTESQGLLNICLILIFTYCRDTCWRTLWQRWRFLEKDSILFENKSLWHIMIDIDIPWREGFWYLSNCLSYHLLETHLLTDSQKEIPDLKRRLRFIWKTTCCGIFLFDDHSV